MPKKQTKKPEASKPSAPIIKTLSLDDLAPADYNPRTISDDALDGLRKSIERFDLVQPIIWNERTKRIVGGHQRVKALRQLGRTEAQVVVVDLPETEEKALNIALNSPAIAGEFTDDLQALLDEIAQEDEALFEDLRLGELVIEVEEASAVVGLTDPDAIPEAPSDPITKQGDLWLLGRHRLLCGDSTNALDVARLLGDAMPSLMVTDPPYGVEYDPSWRASIPDKKRKKGSSKNKNTQKLGVVEKDDKADWRDAWALWDGDACYVYHAGLFGAVVLESLEACDLIARSQIIWGKENFTFGRGDYHWKHEPCWYAVRKGRSSGRNDDRTQATVWEIPARDDSGHGHGTQKPVECMARPIRNHVFSEVYDPFLGSGTTMIAAEKEGVTCYGMEISPRYCDVIVKRWEDFTGQKAVLSAPTGDVVNG